MLAFAPRDAEVRLSSPLGVGERRRIGRIQTGGESVYRIAGPGDLGERAGELLDLSPEGAYLFDRDAGVEERAPQLVGHVRRTAEQAVITFLLSSLP